MLEQCLGMRAILRGQRDTDAGADVHHLATDEVSPLKQICEAIRQDSSIFCRQDRIEQNRKLIVRQAQQAVMLA